MGFGDFSASRAAGGRRNAASVICLFLVAACTQSDPEHQAASQAIGATPVLAEMPELVPVELRPILGTGFTGTAISVAVTDGGVIGMLEPSGPNDPVLLLIDIRTGDSRKLLRRGEGPGELSGAGVISARADSFDILDLGRSLILTVASDGSVLRETGPVSQSHFVMAIGPDSMDVIPLFGAADTGIVRRPRRGSGGRVLIPLQDSFYRATIDAGTREGVTTRMIPFGSGGDRVVVGMGREYRLAIYRSDGARETVFGRALAPRHRTDIELGQVAVALGAESGRSPGSPEIRRELERLRREPMPHFEHYGIWLDDDGRAWVAGMTGDSSFIDVFAGETHLGRVSAPCMGSRRRVGHSHNWVVMICDQDGISRELPFILVYEVR